VYSENVAHAHILASEALKPGSVAAGQCYFITDFEPENFFDFMTPFLKGLGYPAATISLPYGLAYGLAAVSEIVNPRSAFNRFAVIQTCVDHTFSHAKAARDLGYKPIVSRNEAFEKTLAWFRSHPGP
jgi:nucleoside-diphosphate-sugar epimerase